MTGFINDRKTMFPADDDTDVSKKMKQHPVEESKSWELYLKRIESSEGKEGNYDSHDDYVDAEGHRHLKRKHHNHGHKHKKKHHYWNHQRIPDVGSNTFHAMMIDAGSQGTRIHIYEFEKRVLYNKKETEKALNGLKLSTPTTNSRWTNRLHPGLDACAFHPDDEKLQKVLTDYLSPLLEFAKTVLEEKEDEWHDFPIYLKATGGLRTLPTKDRVRLIKHVRELFRSKEFNPFKFEDEYARVISGEEEAIYGWAGVNYIKGTLVKQSEGIGTVLSPNLTYGMIEMGGASTQIGFFENNGDVMANLFKLQIGGARHWNVYVHSFLYFGVNGAWSRLNADLYSNALHDQNKTSNVTDHVQNPCLPASSNITFTSWIHMNDRNQFIQRSSPLSTPYSITMYNDQQASFESCSIITRKLLRKEANDDWVTFSHDGDASFAGIYQPPLPISSIGGFIATSNFADIWSFLNIKETATVAEVGQRAKVVCNYDERKLVEYNSKLDHPKSTSDSLNQYCFRSVFVYEMLYTGYGFPLDYKITAVDTLNNQKLGWALGSILYEINTLPWEFDAKLKIKEAAEEETIMTTRSSMMLVGESRPDVYYADEDESVMHVSANVFLGVMAVVVGLVLHARSRSRNNTRIYQSIPNDDRNEGN